MDQVLDLAEHLVEWRKARPILPMTSRSVYTIASNAPIEKYEIWRCPRWRESSLELSNNDVEDPFSSLLTWKEEFRELFADKDLFAIIGRFFELRPFNRSPEEKEVSIEILHWLLQKKLVVQLHTQIYLVDPLRNILPCSAEEDKDFVETINRMVIDKPPMVADLFRRVCIYFNGNHCIEEILWRESLNWAEIDLLLNRFRNELIMCLHEPSSFQEFPR
jgi:hypothetical protein